MIVITFLLIFGTYLYTLCPTISTGDSGEFCAASVILGLSHSPGYPLYSLLGKIFTLSIPFGNLAYRINLLSAVFSCLSLLLIGKMLLQFGKNNNGSTLFEKITVIISLIILALSPALWKTSIQAEVFTLNIFFIALIVYFSVSSLPLLIKLYMVFFLTGLGIGNHLTLVLVIPGLALFLYSIIKKNNYSLSGLLSAKHIAGCILFFLIGYSVYLYLPVRANKAPALNWGNPVTVQKFWRVFTRADYGTLSLTVGEKMARSASSTIQQLGRFIKGSSNQYGIIGFLTGLLGIYYGMKKHRHLSIMLLTTWLLAGPGFFLLSNLPFTAESEGILERFFIIANIPFIFFIFFGIMYLSEINGISSALKKPAITLLLILLILSNTAKNWSSANWRGYYLTYDYGKNMLKTMPPGAVFFMDGGDDTFYSLSYLCFAQKQRTDVELHDRGGLVFKSVYGDDFRQIPKEEKELRRQSTEKTYTGYKPLLYSTFNKNLLPEYTLVQQGILYRVKDSRFPFNETNLFDFYSLRSMYTGYEDYRSRALVPVYPYFLALIQKNNLYLSYFSYAYTNWQEVSWLKSNMLIELQQRAYKMFTENKPDTAINYYRKIIVINPDDLSSYTNLGVVYEKENDLSSAKQVYSQIIASHPEHADAYYNLGVIYWKENNWNKVIENYKKVLELNPGHAAAKHYLEQAIAIQNKNHR